MGRYKKYIKWGAVLLVIIAIVVVFAKTDLLRYLAADGDSDSFALKEMNIVGEIIFSFVGAFLGLFCAIKADEYLDKQKEKDDQVALLSSIKKEIGKLSKNINEANRYDVNSTLSFFQILVNGGGILRLFETPYYEEIVSIFKRLSNTVEYMKEKNVGMFIQLVKDGEFKEYRTYFEILKSDLEYIATAEIDNPLTLKGAFSVPLSTIQSSIHRDMHDYRVAPTDAKRVSDFNNILLIAKSKQGSIS